MNTQTRTLVLLGVIVLAAALVIWTFAARGQRQTSFPPDALREMANIPAHDEDEAGTSLCDDLALGDGTGMPPGETRRTEDVVLYEGDPERDHRVKRMTGSDSSYWVWKLPGTPDGYWIECRYEGGAARAQRLPDSVSECIVALQRSAQTPVIRGVACL